MLDYVVRDNLFKGDAFKMDIDSFQRCFFPQYFQVEDDNQSDYEDKKNKMEQKSEVAAASDHDSESRIQHKLQNLEDLIKVKFANNWTSVRKAFLDLDSDFDGFITVEDILRYFGSEDKELDFKDLTKLIGDKD